MDRGILVIGVDVGGTNTDAVLLDSSRSGPDAVISSYKATTGTDVTTGIEEAVKSLLLQAQVSSGSIKSIMIGTTHFINAVVERDASRLDPVAVIRLASGAYLTHTPPFVDFPPALRKIIDCHWAKVSGGVEIDGEEIGQVRNEDILEQAKHIKDKDIQKVAVVGIYSPFDNRNHQEYHVRNLLKENLPDSVDIVCSSDVAGVGFLARENATILNASILNFARRTIKGFQRAMRRLKLRCPLYLTSNSGQLLSAEEAMLYPIQVFSSGATNSVRGAAFLSNEHKSNKSRYVIDIGGTTTDIGCLLSTGFPRLSSTSTEIGGVRVNFAMPQVESIGLGGGSIVHDVVGKKCSIGPDSVGQSLKKRAKCFGGDSLTATDIMVASGKVRLGTMIPDLQLSMISKAVDTMKRMIEDHIDRMKTSPHPCQVLLVGGGAFLCPDELAGVTSIEIPRHAEVANAVGAAVAEICQVNEVVVDATEKDVMLSKTKEKTIAEAISRGAKPDQIRIIEEDVSGIPAIEGKFKITVKVAGPIEHKRFLDGTDFDTWIEPEAVDRYNETKSSPNDMRHETEFDTQLDHTTYTPHVDSNRIWHLSETDAYYISIGCYILGCAGGGTPYGSFLQIRQLLRDGGCIQVVDIGDLPENAVVGPVAGMGSPIIAIERLGGDMILHAMKGMEDHLDIKFTAVLTAEIGGANGLAALILASSRHKNIPCVDGDLMGRAFPAFEMSSLFIGADNINHLLPACLSSGDGTTLTLTSAKNSKSVDKVLRAVCITMGLAAGISARPASKSELQQYAIPKSMSLSWRLGRAVAIARSKSTITTIHEDIIREFGGSLAASKVFEGKIVGIEQMLYKGHSHGALVIEKLKDYENETANKDTDDVLQEVRIPFINENLMIEGTSVSGVKKIIATVPDLIMLLDILTGESVGVPEYRYGLKVPVLVAAAHPLWTSTERALDIAGPRAFNLETEFRSCGTYQHIRSVIDEYAPLEKS